MERKNGSQLGCTEILEAAAKVNKERTVLERDSGPRLEARREEMGREKVAKVNARVCWSCGKTGHIAANCVMESWNRSLNAAEEDKGGISEEVRGDEDDAWLVFVGGERMSNGKKFAYESLLSVGNNSCGVSKEVIEVKDKWVNSRATMNTGAAGHFILAVQQMEKISKSWVRKPYHASPREGVHRCIKFRSANVVKPLI